MLAQCIQECFHGQKCIKYTTDGGPNNDGFYDIDPLDPIAQYFSFPPGTLKYEKVPGDKKTGKDPVERTVVVGGEMVAAKDPLTEKAEAEGPTKKQLMAQLDTRGIGYKVTMNKAELAGLLAQE
ncbi:MAG: hypothetical protein WC373_06630 [Smithella sp.]|jgi:hypothetical protein